MNGFKLRVAASVPLLLSLACAGGAASAPRDGGITDGGAPDAGVVAAPATPITAPPRAWTWVDDPGATCSDGSATGFAVNPGGPNLLVYLQGGGACWDYLTCFVIKTATAGPYTSTQFNASAALFPQSILDRAAAGNPFKDFSLVFVPYCTGDVHAGDNVVTYSGFGTAKTWHHTGRANLTRYLARIAATFTSPAKLFISGSSAGGFGSAINYRLIRTVYPAAESYLLDDSGPFLIGDAVSTQLRTAWTAGWGLKPWIDSECPACAADLSALYPTIATRYQNDRLALLSTNQDAVISAFFQISQSQFKTDLTALTTQRLTPLANARFFVIDSTSHVLLENPNAASFADGGTLMNWLTQMATDDPAWSSSSP